jgi:hypothetical protein
MMPRTCTRTHTHTCTYAHTHSAFVTNIARSSAGDYAMVYARNALTASPTPKRPVSLLLPAGSYITNDPKEGTKELYCIVIVRFWGQSQSARQYDVPSRSGFRIRALWWVSLSLLPLLVVVVAGRCCFDRRCLDIILVIVVFCEIGRVIGRLILWILVRDGIGVTVVQNSVST